MATKFQDFTSSAKGKIAAAALATTLISPIGLASNDAMAQQPQNKETISLSEEAEAKYQQARQFALAGNFVIVGFFKSGDPRRDKIEETIERIRKDFYKEKGIKVGKLILGVDADIEPQALFLFKDFLPINNNETGKFYKLADVRERAQMFARIAVLHGQSLEAMARQNQAHDNRLN